jgi:HEAT repeat protein
MVELLSRLAVDANQSAMVRRAAVRALRGAGTAQFPDNLIRISLDGPPGVRLFAIDLLAHQGNNPRALIQVIEADLPDTLRIRAMRHAARSGQLNAVPILIQIAKHRDHSTHLRQAAIFSMGLLGDQHSAIHLRALAQTGPVATRVVACKALAQFSDAQSRDLLRRIGLDPTLEDALRVTAIESLANLRDDALLNWLQSDGSSH